MIGSIHLLTFLPAFSPFFQLQKLGLISPFTPLSGQFLRHYQELWANNGDTISRQYTGTDAMKVTQWELYSRVPKKLVKSLVP